MKTTDEKFKTVIEMNTFWYSNRKFETTYEGYINALKENLLHLKNRVETEKLSVELIADFLDEEGEDGLTALLALTGFSYELLKRVFTFIRIKDAPELNALVYRDQWLPEDENDSAENIREWGNGYIERRMGRDAFFRLGVVNVFFKGARTGMLYEALPLFHLKKLSFSKMNFDMEALLDTLVRYKVFGSYNAKRETNPERVVERLLKEIDVGYAKGDLSELIDNAPSEYLSKDYGGKKAGLHPFGPLVSDVWTDIHRVKHNRYRDEHPCQLPIHLLERLILMSSDEGDTVLDPFMGTGTTALAAKRLGRKYIGIELDAKYVEIAESKLSQEMSDSKLGDAWVSFFLRKVATLRNIDWDIVVPYFIIPEDRKQIDVTEIELNKDIDEIRDMRHIYRRSARKKSDRPDKKSLSSRLSQDSTLFDTDREPA